MAERWDKKGMFLNRLFICTVVGAVRENKESGWYEITERIE